MERKLKEIAANYGVCERCGGVTNSGGLCRTCSLARSRRLHQQAESRRRLTAEREAAIMAVNRKLLREQQQLERIERGISPYAKGHGRPDLTSLPEEIV